MVDPLLIYGATGFTGKLCTQAALDLGLRPVLAGRDAGRVAAVAAPLGLSHRAAPLDDPMRLAALLRGMRVVLHAAGPFSATSAPMAAACLAAGVHYLDIAGEVSVLDALAARHREARARGVMLMPAVGFDVVPSDCLAALVAGRLARPKRLALGFTGLQFATRGSLRTLVEHAGVVRVRRDGLLTDVVPGTLRRTFDYGAGARESLHVSWGDIVTAHYTTGVPDVTVYFDATPSLRGMLAASRHLGWALRTPPAQAWMKAHAVYLPEGPSPAERAAARMTIVAEAEDAAGRRASARLHTPEAYTLTGLTAAEIARRVLRGDTEPGFQTPGRVFGADFILGFPGVTREDVTC